MPGGRLEYPFTSSPAPGAALAAVPGVMWLRMPLPMAGLDHINVWALEDGAGWCLVDTGMKTEATRAAWSAASEGPLCRRPATRVVCTHMHPDHVGMAGWLTRAHDCRLWMTRLEYVTCRMLVADTGREAPPEGVRFYRAAGWDEDDLAHYRERFGSFGRAVHALPDSYRRVVDGETLVIGGDGLAGRPRPRTLPGAPLPLQRRAPGTDLRRPGAAADHLERLGVPHRAGRRSACGVARVARPGAGAHTG